MPLPTSRFNLKRCIEVSRVLLNIIVVSLSHESQCQRNILLLHSKRTYAEVENSLHRSTSRAWVAAMSVSPEGDIEVLEQSGIANGHDTLKGTVRPAEQHQRIEAIVVDDILGEVLPQSNWGQ